MCSGKNLVHYPYGPALDTRGQEQETQTKKHLVRNRRGRDDPIPYLGTIQMLAQDRQQWKAHNCYPSCQWAYRSVSQNPIIRSFYNFFLADQNYTLYIE